MENYSVIKRNASESGIMRWMNLEPIMQSEVSQIEKTKDHILVHIYITYEDGTDACICSAAMKTQMRRTILWTWGRGEGEGRTKGDSSMETYSLPCVK